MKKKYKVLSSSGRKVWIVEGKNLSKTDAIKLSKKEKGIYCGESKNSIHKKSRNKVKGKHCYSVATKIKVDLK